MHKTDNTCTGYLHKKTLIKGDVNTGKTAKTISILQSFLLAGYREKVAIIDLSPREKKGVGGKMPLSAVSGVFYLTADIHAPRLEGKDEGEILFFAKKNAATIETLFDACLNREKEKNILFVNDATLYLQAGDIMRFFRVLESASTWVVNVFEGNFFQPSIISEQEKTNTGLLEMESNQVLTMPEAVKNG